MRIEREFMPVKLVFLNDKQINEMYEFAIYAEEKSRTEVVQDEDEKSKNIDICLTGQQIINLLKQYIK